MAGVTTSISPCLWFDDDLEEAISFYTGIFPNSSVGNVLRNTEASHGETGAVVAADFVLDGLTFHAINGGPQFSFSEAISFEIACRDQSEVDYYWDSLVDGGEESMCGWLKDRYGVSWQIVPEILPRLLNDPDKARAGRVMQAMMKMIKIDVARIEEAAKD